MTAGIRIYDPDTGKITFDTTDGLSRIVKVINDSSTSGSYTVPANVVGGGTVFWVAVDQFGWRNSTFATVNGNKVTYTKNANRTLLIGVYS